MMVNEGSDVIKVDAIKQVLLASKEEELQKILEANKNSANKSSAGLKEKDFNIGIFNITLIKGKDGDPPQKSRACIIQ